ncbi:MAG TPA: hypothetical protein PLL26_07270 [Candidatus Dojkabacteria bacterium]|nr:hypothetical protein [Candidatus Dojkabacteria bacterium]
MTKIKVPYNDTLVLNMLHRDDDGHYELIKVDDTADHLFSRCVCFDLLCEV